MPLLLDEPPEPDRERERHPEPPEPDREREREPPLAERLAYVDGGLPEPVGEPTLCVFASGSTRTPASVSAASHFTRSHAQNTDTN